MQMSATSPSSGRISFGEHFYQCVKLFAGQVAIGIGVGKKLEELIHIPTKEILVAVARYHWR